MADLTLYSYWRSSSSYRVRIALGLKRLAYEYVPVHLVRDGGEQHWAGFRQRNPLGQVPVLEWADGRALTQSLPIIEYLDELHPQPPLLPQEPFWRAHARMLAEIINAGIQPLQNLSVLQYVEGQCPGIDRHDWAHHFIAKGLDAVEHNARGHAGTFLVGDTPSLADVCLIPQLYSARRFGIQPDAFPTLMRVEEQCMQLEAFRAAHPARQPDAERVPASR